MINDIFEFLMCFLAILIALAVGIAAVVTVIYLAYHYINWLTG